MSTRRWLVGVLLVLGGCPSDPPAVNDPSLTGNTGDDASKSDGDSGDSPSGATSENGVTEAVDSDAATSTSGPADAESCGECSTETSPEDATGASLPPLPCVDATVVGTGQALAQFDTNETLNRFTEELCGSNSGDAWIEWIAPESGYYVFDTGGSAFDSTLSLRSGTCDPAPVITCNDDAPVGANIGYASEIIRFAEAGERFIAIIDGFDGSSGLAFLNINPLTCPSIDVLDLTTDIVVEGTLAQAPSDPLTSCGGTRVASLAYRLESTVPGGALYRFRVTSEDFDPLIALDSGPACGREPLQCNRGFGTGSAEVVKRLFGSDDDTTGNIATISVDAQGGQGDFVLTIEKIDVQCPSGIESQPDPTHWVLTGDIDTFEQGLVPSCGPSVGANPVGVLEPVPSASFGLDEGNYGPCEFSYTGGFPAAISLTDDYCNLHAEHLCEVATTQQNGSFVGTFPQRPIPFGPVVTVTPLSMDRSQWTSSTFTVNVDCR